MYVISTLKRPVPLEHYLYTGVTGKSKDERFLIVNADGAFVTEGYMSAMKAKKAKEIDAKAGAPAGPGKGPGAAKPPVRQPTGGGHKGIQFVRLSPTQITQFFFSSQLGARRKKETCLSLYLIT